MSFITVRKPDEFDQLIAHAEQNLRLYHTLSGGYGKSADKAARAEYWLERGEFTSAETLLSEILRGCSVGRNKEKNITTSLVARFSLARLYAASGRQEEAALMLETMRSQISGTDAIMHVDCVELAEGYIHAVCGNLKGIPQWLREGRVLEPPHALQPQVFGFSLTIYGKALMLQEEWHLLAHVAEKIPDSTPQECLFARIHSAILHSVAAWHISGQDKALSLLREALDLSRPDCIILSLAEYGRYILPLLRLLKRKESGNEHLEEIETLAKRITAISSMASNNKNGLLTPREKELLRLVAQGKSNPVIAKNLGISNDTVKEHLSRAYAKLGVTGRMEAARRFTELFGNGTSEFFQS
ncbi:LuxR C-terminal-related transcriptional regulator [Desulfovibrio sp. OttesenSCG-928-I05]|nr:LuxR C-terminal-related transcriptional regulator [Desulfovibrio sp. OttesenSCG-928-I05]